MYNYRSVHNVAEFSVSFILTVLVHCSERHSEDVSLNGRVYVLGAGCIKFSHEFGVGVAMGGYGCGEKELDDANRTDWMFHLVCRFKCGSLIALSSEATNCAKTSSSSLLVLGLSIHLTAFSSNKLSASSRFRLDVVPISFFRGFLVDLVLTTESLSSSSSMITY